MTTFLLGTVTTQPLKSGFIVAIKKHDKNYSNSDRLKLFYLDRFVPRLLIIILATTNTSVDIYIFINWNLASGGIKIYQSFTKKNFTYFGNMNMTSRDANRLYFNELQTIELNK